MKFRQLFKWLGQRHKSTSTETPAIDGSRRRILGGLLAGGGLAMASNTVKASDDDGESLRFPGDPAEHKIVYQFNKGDEDFHKSVLFSVGAMLRKWGDNIEIVVVGIGPGIHILARNPGRPVSEETRQRVSSLSQYGVEFHACGNTMKALDWGEDDLLPFVKVVEVGASDLMELQEQGYAYISW